MGFGGGRPPEDEPAEPYRGRHVKRGRAGPPGQPRWPGGGQQETPASPLGEQPWAAATAASHRLRQPAGPPGGNQNQMSDDAPSGPQPPGAAGPRRPEAPQGPGRDSGPGGNGGGTTGSEPPAPPRYGTPRPSSRPEGWRRHLLPALLLVGVVGAGGGALVLAGSPSASALGSSSPETPVLSARRAPEVLTAPVAARRLAPELETWVAEAPADTCLVVESSGSTLFGHNGDLPVPGASLQKIVTGTAALVALGADGRFETVAAATADVGADGVLAGDLHLIGGGDPLLATAGYGNQRQRGGELLHDLEQLVDAIEEAGVTRIQGSVVGDESRYDSVRFHSAWPERFRGQNQIGPVSALNVNDGFSDFPAEYAGLASMVQSGDPPANAARVVTDLLAQRGITVDGSFQAGEAPADLTPVATLPSQPMSDIVAETLTNSDNDTAEMLLKEVGLQEAGEGTWEAGAVGVTDVLTGAGIPMEGVEIVDGSGLSSDNRMTCDLVVDLMSRPETGPHIVEGLAVAGETGTLEDRFDGTEVAGRLRGKTGTLQNVSALSGQVTPPDGGTLTFAYITTVAEGAQLEWEQIDRVDELPEILVRHDDGVELDQLLPAGYTEPS